MKNYLVLLLFTIFIIFCIVISPFYIKHSNDYIDVINLESTVAQSTIICSGKVEYKNIQTVFAPSLSIAEKIYINEGDRVSKGDPLIHMSGAMKNNLKPNVYNNKTDFINQGSLPNLSEVYKSIVESEKKDFPIDSLYTSDGKYYNINAPCSGIVSSIGIKNKAAADQNFPLCTIADTSNLQIKASINESQISDIKIGQRVEITGMGFKNSKYLGKVQHISPEAKQIVNTTGKETAVEVIIDINNVKKDIKAGFTAKCKIITCENDNTVIVPYESVRADQNNKEYVYKIEDDTAIKTYISTGREFENGFEVISGLIAGNKIISTPDKVFNGLKIESSNISEVKIDV